jgi:hypothetical protein
MIWPAKNALQTTAPNQEVATGDSTGLMRLIERATLDPSFDVAKLGKLLDVKERWEATEARKAFVVANADFRAEAPKLLKNRHVGYDLKTGGRTEYDHATLDSIAEALAPILGKHGLTYRWETGQADASIKVTCVLTHVLGHSEAVMLQAPPDQSGGKNSIQAVASTVSYLMRYTLLAITGLATSDQDDDGAYVGFITGDQKDELIELMKETGADTAKFLAYLKIPTIDQLPGRRFDEAKGALERKGAAK